jgi:hypothetical protein
LQNEQGQNWIQKASNAYSLAIMKRLNFTNYATL